MLDLTRAYVDEDADDELAMSVFSLFGSVSILLPPGCDVEPSGVAIAASSAVEIPSEKQRDVTRDVLAPFDISWIALFAKVRVAEIAPDPLDQTARGVLAVPSGPAAIERSVLEPPAVEVFDVTSESASAPPVDAAVIDPEPEVAAPSPTAVDDAESEAATVRDEIAQWRAESGRGPSTDAEANDDADDAIPEIVG